MKISVFLFLFFAASVAHAQNFKRGSEFTFEYPAVRTVSGGCTRSYSYPARQPQMIAVLAEATRMSLYPALSFAVAVEAETSIDGISYRLLFPRIPQREAPYVFAVTSTTSPANRVYFEIPRERYAEFSRLFAHVLNEHAVDSRQ